MHFARPKEIRACDQSKSPKRWTILSQELLHSTVPVRLAYNQTDGLPRAIPIGILWKDERIIVCTASNAYKVRALAANPRVALTIDTEAPYRALLVRGTASLEIVDGLPPEYLEAARKNPGGRPPMGLRGSKSPNISLNPLQMLEAAAGGPSYSCSHAEDARPA